MQVEERLRETEMAFVELGEEYDSLLEQHKTVHVILSILLEEAGGLVKISDELLTGYDMRGLIQMWNDPSDMTWNIKVVPYEEQGEL